MERKSHNSAVKQRGTKHRAVKAQPTPDQIVVAMQHAVQRIRRMSHRERVQSLQEAGILTTAGNLSAYYK